jgi:hypothetical protein
MCKPNEIAKDPRIALSIRPFFGHLFLVFPQLTRRDDSRPH